MKNNTETKQRIIDTIRTLGRPGTDAVIAYLGRSNYFTRGCYSHHKERGGLAAHSLEVYDHMLAHAGGLPADSVAVVALFHDLGKTRRRDGRGHGRRSLDTGAPVSYVSPSFTEGLEQVDRVTDFNPMVPGDTFETPVFEFPASFAGRDFPMRAGHLPGLFLGMLSMLGVDGVVGMEILGRVPVVIAGGEVRI